MGLLYSCILRATQIVTGPPPPDGGGGTDPDGGCIDVNNNGICDDEEEDDCEGRCYYAYCDYTGAECSVDPGIRFDDFDKELLVTAGLMADCSDPCPTSFEIGGTQYVPADSAGSLDCCIDLTYVYCADPLQICPKSGCTGEVDKSYNLLLPDDAPNTVTAPTGSLAYRTKQLCNQANLGCCEDPEVVEVCDIYWCENGEVEYAKIESSFLPNNECPNTSCQGIPFGGRTIYGAKDCVSWCTRCERWDCNEDLGECVGTTYIVNTLADNSLCDQGYPSKDSCEGDVKNPCCSGYDPPGGGGAGAPGAPEILEGVLLDAYGGYNDAYNNNQPGDYTYCPQDQLLVLEPFTLPAAFTGQNNYDKEVFGVEGASIGQQDGVISIPIQSLIEGGTTKELAVTYTKTCGNPPVQASVSIFFDPSDFVTCNSFNECVSLGIPDGCGFSQNNEAEIVSLQVWQTQPIESPVADVLLFEWGQPFGYGELEMTIPITTWETPLRYWDVCFPELTSQVKVIAYDQQGNRTEMNSVQLTPASQSPGQWNQTASTPITSDNSEWLVQLENISPNAYNQSSPPGIRAYGSLTVGNASTPQKTFTLYVNPSEGGGAQGVASPPNAAFPEERQCGPSTGELPSGGNGNSLTQSIINFLSRRNNFRRFRLPSRQSRGYTSTAILNYDNHLKSRRRSEVLFDPVLANKRYRQRVNVPFIPFRTTYFPNIFNEVIDYRIELIRRFYEDEIEEDYSEAIFQDLTLDNIQRSLSRSSRNLVNEKIGINGESIRRDILQHIKELIITDQLDTFDIEELRTMVTESSNSNLSQTTTRSYADLNNVYQTLQNSKSVDPNDYTGENRERVLRWKTIASDLEKKLPLVETDLSIEELVVNDTDTINLTLSDGTPSSIPINDFDEVNFIYRDGVQSVLPLDTQIHRSKVMDFEELIASFASLGETFDIKLTVTTAAVAKIEEEASLEDARPDKYVLKLKPETLQDLDRRNPVIRLTSCDYELMTDAEEIESWAKTKTYPFYNFYVNHNDLFLDHLEKKKSVNIEYKDITFDNFSNSESEEFPVVPRRIPWYIVVIPTDRNDYISSIGLSKLVDYQTRVLRFKITPRTSEYKQNFDSLILDEEPGVAVENTATGERYIESFNYKYNDNKVREKVKPYKQGSEVLPRREPATRALFRAIREVVDDGNEFVERNSNTISWGSVYKRMSKKDKKSLALVDTLNFQDLRSKLLLGKISSNDTVNQEFGKVKDAVNTGIGKASEFKPVSAQKLTIEGLVAETPELLE